MEMNGKPVALWSVPRSLSTAFERVFIERGDFEVFHEPFSLTYYYSPERRSERFAEESSPENRHECVLQRVLAPERPVFIKDMAYHTAGFMGEELAHRFTNTFLIRQPAQVLLSLHEMWPDFTFEEAGYEQLHRLFEHAVDAGQSPVVVDAYELSTDTEAVISSYCDALGIPHRPEALSWEPGEVSGWGTWEGWHQNVQKSTCIVGTHREEPKLPEELRPAHERCLPFYEVLHAERLQPANT